MGTKNKTTVGKIALDLLTSSDKPVSVIEQMRESLTDYEKSLLDCLESGQKTYLKDFFINVIFKKEPLMDNVFRCFFIHRKTCPTPDYDQIVYRYDKTKDTADFLWVIPSRPTCIYLRNNAIEVVNEERDLLKFVLDFADGTLMKKALILNDENIAAPQGALIKTDTRHK